MAIVQNLNSLVTKLRSRLAKALRDADPGVAVGYSASYAVYVHENLEAYHPNGQAKFLEQPARRNQKEMAEIVLRQLARDRTLAQAFLAAGLYLQAASQKLCPVKTGALKNSAFTRLE
jgi:hypothetical protein